MLAALGLVGLAFALTAPAPRLLARVASLRRAPREALVLWQAVSLAAVVSAVALGPVAVLLLWPDQPLVIAAAVVLSAGVLLRVLVSGHQVGTRLRADRRRNRTLVDALGTDPPPGHAAELRVIAHPTPTAYCLPGLRRRVVLSEGALAALPPDELAAVLAHERAHLRARHDLVLEFFTVLHTAAPRWLRAAAALREVQLLIEVLADRAARRAAGEVALGRALVTLARGEHPDAALGAARDRTESATRARMELLAQPEASALARAGVLAAAAAVVAAPVALAALAVG